MQEGELYTGGSRRNLQSGSTAYSSGVVEVAVFENGTGMRYSMGELSGQTVATFDVRPDTYANNQTVCMAYSDTRRIWDSELCITELKVQNIQLKCICNAFDSKRVGLFTDKSRILGPAIEFPEIELAEVQYYQGFELIPSEPVDSIQSLDSAGFVWISQSVLVAMLCISGSLIALKFDRADKKEYDPSIMRTAPA